MILAHACDNIFLQHMQYVRFARPTTPRGMEKFLVSYNAMRYAPIFSGTSVHEFRVGVGANLRSPPDLAARVARKTNCGKTIRVTERREHKTSAG